MFTYIGENIMSLINTISKSIDSMKKKQWQKTINNRFIYEMDNYWDTKNALSYKPHDEKDIKYYISERSENILFLMRNTNLGYTVTRGFLTDLNNGLLITQKKALINILKSNENIDFEEDDLKILNLNIEDTSLLYPKEIGVAPSKIDAPLKL